MSSEESERPRGVAPDQAATQIRMMDAMNQGRDLR